MLAASAAAPKKRATKGDDDSKPPKKPRKQAVQIPEGKKIADAILAAPDEYSVPTDSEAVRKLLIELASYARSLESHAELGAKIAAKAKPPKTPEELQAAADKLARTIANGISKVMKWTDLCKINSAKFTFQHACEPDVFAKIMGLDEPPTWKTKKMPVNEFKETFGEVCGHARYSTLYVTGNEVAIHWTEAGLAKFTGSYGIGVTKRAERLFGL